MDTSAASRPTVSLVAAIARNGGIGRGGQLLVRLPEDLRHFKRVTLGSPIVMGRKTWDSIGRPLPGRRNIVITRDAAWKAEGADRAGSLESALAMASPAAKVYVIGGAEIYRLALPLADELVLTEIDADYDADTFFPAWPRAAFRETTRDTHRSPEGFDFHIVTYQKN
jgi:dihydrofolate reductase